MTFLDPFICLHLRFMSSLKEGETASFVLLQQHAEETKVFPEARKAESTT